MAQTILRSPQTRARELLPRASVTLQCDVCGEKIAEVSLATTSLASELFRRRKEHAKLSHHWQEPS